MTVNEAIRAFANVRADYPTEAMQWTLDNRERDGLRFVAMLNEYAQGREQPIETTGDLFIPPRQPRIDPNRDLGRNDPCPRGGGGGKKCCLMAA